MKIAVIGGGAAGLMAALTAAERGDVTILERCARVGRKLSVTGNGRCNLTNLNISPEKYHGGDPGFPVPALNSFGPARTLELFRSMGLVTVAESSGRVYPLSDQAGSVVDVLRFAVAERGVSTVCSAEVRKISRRGGGFVLCYGDEQLHADRLIVAAGGPAGTRAGGTELGLELLESLGHHRTAITPSLVQLKTENTFTRPLKGVRADAAVEVVSRSGIVLARSAGEVQFTEYGLSGPAIFEVSRAAVRAEGCRVRLDFLRQMGPEELKGLLLLRRSTSLTAENLLTGVLHNKLGRTIVTCCGISLAARLSSLDDGEIEKVAGAVKRTELPVTGSLGMEGAQVTAGGIDTREFDPETLESRLVPGLFACGEVLDVDGDCGGFNLQWAWSSGYTAGRLGEKRC